eukprot:gene18521-biopygen15606
MEDTQENKKIEEESCTDVQEEFMHGIERMNEGKEVVPGVTHIEYHAPVIYIASGEAPITIGNIEQDVNGDKEAVVSKPQSVNGATENAEDNTYKKPTEKIESENNSNEDFSGLRKRYRKECAKHEVNCVEHGYIKPLNLHIQDFAVNLTIREEKRRSAADKSFQGEMDRHMESLKDHGHTIKFEELLNMVQDNKKGRIVFVSGIAGIGKSVLAKRIAYDWSCSEKYRHVKCCLYITCRKLNNFLYKSDKEIEIEEIEKYFEDVSIEDDKATLFLIDGLDELQKPDMIQAFTEKFPESKFLILGRPHSQHFVDKIKESFVRFSLIEKTSSFDDEEDVSYQLITRLGDEMIRDGDERNKVTKNRGDGVITYEDAQSVIRGILNKLPNNEVLLKMRFLADCFVTSDKVRDANFLVKLLKSIKPSSNINVGLEALDQSNMLSILKLATGNKMAYSEIKNTFSGIKFDIDDLKEMELFAYTTWMDIGWVQMKNIEHFTVDQSLFIHRNVAFCGGVGFFNCKVLLFTTNANESSTTTTTLYNVRRSKKIRLKKLRMWKMNIGQSELSSAANLFGLAEEVRLTDVWVGAKDFEWIMKKLIEMDQPRLKRMFLYRCPLVNYNVKQKMKENGVIIYEDWPRSPILILCEPESRDFVLQLKEKLDDKNGHIAMDENIEEFKRRYNELPCILVVFVQHQISEKAKNEILFAKNKRIKILLVKLEADFHPSEALSFVFDPSPCLDFTEKRNSAEMAIELNRTILAIIADEKFIVISNAPGNQVEAIQLKQKFADEIGCPVFVNVELWKYEPRVVVVLLTGEYEKSEKCSEMMKYAESWDPMITAVKLDNDFHPGEPLNIIQYGDGV